MEGNYRDRRTSPCKMPVGHQNSGRSGANGRRRWRVPVPRTRPAKTQKKVSPLGKLHLNLRKLRDLPLCKRMSRSHNCPFNQFNSINTRTINQ